jgi:hypothetical protein
MVIVKPGTMLLADRGDDGLRTWGAGDHAALPLTSITAWETLFERLDVTTEDIGEQGKLLGEVSRLVDEGALRSTMMQQYSPIDASNLRRAHALIESGRACGKIVLEGFAAPAR